MRISRHGLTSAVILSVGLQAANYAQAATCKDELDQFERRLHSSSMAADDPGAFEELVRLAEEAAELRDEDQCLQRVAELNEALPEDNVVQPLSQGQDDSSAGSEAQAAPSRPRAPVLLIADDGDGTGTEPGEQAGDESAAFDDASGDDNGDR